MIFAFLVLRAESSSHFSVVQKAEAEAGQDGVANTRAFVIYDWHHPCAVAMALDRQVCPCNDLSHGNKQRQKELLANATAYVILAWAAT